MAALTTLDPAEVHLWFAAPPAITDQHVLDAQRAVLDDEEIARMERFYFARHRHEFLVSHALVRQTLSRYAAVEPAAWRFSKNSYGRPAIDMSDPLPPLRFNLSHTDGLVVVGVTLRDEIGVDVEDTHRRGRTVEIADSFFSPAEVEDLHALPPEARRDRFFDYWTLKESYIKARGMGLSLPLDQFSFQLGALPQIDISFDPRLEDDPERWQFLLFSPTPRHRAAAALAVAPKRRRARIRAWKTVPFGESQEPLQIRTARAPSS